MNIPIGMCMRISSLLEAITRRDQEAAIYERARQITIDWVYLLKEQNAKNGQEKL